MDYEKPLTKRQRELFAFMLKQKRIDNKVTLKELGSKLGYSIATISNACRLLMMLSRTVRAR